jgi:hypothetical protein
MHYKYILISIFLSCLMAAQGQKSIHLYPIEKNNRFGYINERGKVVIKPQFRNAGDFNNNLAPVRAEGYWGYINKKGVFVIQPQYDFALPFEDGLAVVVKDSLVFQIDTKGMIPKDLALSTLNSPGINLDGVYFLTLLDQYRKEIITDKVSFQKDTSIRVVKKLDRINGVFQHGVEDSMGNLIIPFGIYKNIRSIYIFGDYFFFNASVTRKDGTTIERYGISDTHGKILVQPCYDDFDWKGFVNGILKVSMDGKMAYINRRGQIIWRYTSSDVVGKMNIDYALPYGCYTSKKKIADQPTASEMEFLNALGCAADTFSIRVDCSKYDTIEGKWLGYSFYVVNRSNKKVRFDTFGMGIEMGLEALDVHGVWRTTFIETFGGCMNGTSCIFLEPNHCWTYTVPVFDGLYKTKYRVFATYRNHKGRYATNDTYLKLVSNEFEGGFNPAQFWRSAPSYFEMGFMGK